MGSVPDFKRKLEEQHSFPGIYMFKFIVPSGKEDEVMNILPGGNISSKSSKQGSYVSVTAELMMKSSDEVIAIYEQAHEIEGLIAL